jgi:hypothetical protein
MIGLKFIHRGVFMKRLLTITSFIILFSYCAISKEQNDSVSAESSKGRGYYFGITYDYSQFKIAQLTGGESYGTVDYNHPGIYSSFFVRGGFWPPCVALTSLHNLNKDWDIGLKIGLSTADDAKSIRQYPFWTSLLIAIYGYYYPFETRYFFKFGLENNKYINPDPLVIGNNGKHPGTAIAGYVYHNKPSFRTSYSLGLGYNFENTCLLNIGISIPFYNVYGYHRAGDNVEEEYPMKLYYTLSAGITFLFI